jgi:hypothetical protein
MNADFWGAVAAIAAAVSVFLTFIIAKANISETRTTNRSADFANCLAVVSSLAEAQRRVRDAGGNIPVRDFEFRELLNLMEALALLLNDDKVTPSTRKIVEHFLEEAWAYLHADPSTQHLIISSVTGVETFAELEAFARRRSSSIERLTTAFREQIESQASPAAPTGSATTDGAPE